MNQQDQVSGKRLRQLIVRADDMGSSHAANVACIDCYRRGIVRSVEVMVPCAWFPEAVILLVENPGLDVGVHLTLTSEWERCKWRSLTRAPSLASCDGFFPKLIWTNPAFPPGSALLDGPLCPDEIEGEWRAQIEQACRSIPRISHLSAHMGCTVINADITAMAKQLAHEYGLMFEVGASEVVSMRGWPAGTPVADQPAAFIEALSNLPSGISLFIEHPGLDEAEMQGFGNPTETQVAVQRGAVTRIFTDPAVMDAVRRAGIELISYADLASSAFRKA
ncbi:MAG: ChbG/HpnK family deacetylase [bacterium]